MQNKMLQRPFFNDMVIDNDTVYFPMHLYNALCKGDLVNNQVEIIDIFPETDAYAYGAYRGIYKFKDYLLMSPCNKGDYLIYDIKHAKYMRLTNSRKHSFISKLVYVYSDKLYVMSRETAEIDKIDLQKFSVENMICKEYITDNAQVHNFERVGNLIYIPQNQKRVMLMFDMEKEEYNHIAFPENISHIMTMSYYKERFWITGEDRKIYTWKKNEVKAEEIGDFPNDVHLFWKGNSWFDDTFIYADTLWLFPCFADSILKYNIITKRFEKLEIIGEEESADWIEEELKNGRCYASKYGVVLEKENDRVFFWSSKTRILYELDLKTCNIVRHDLQMNHNFNNRIYPPAIRGVMQEIYYAGGIKCLINNFESKNINNYMKEISNKSIGGIIHSYICD